MKDATSLIDDKYLLVKNIFAHMNEFEQSREIVSRLLDIAESSVINAEKKPSLTGDDLKRSKTKLEVSLYKINLFLKNILLL